MIATAEDARLFFARWQENASHVQIKLRSSALIFDGVGVVLDLSPVALQVGGESWRFTIPVTGATFAFSDPREVALKSVREAEAKKYDFGLAVNLANGDEIVLMELNRAPEEEDPQEA